MLGDTVKERAVCIIPGGNLVKIFFKSLQQKAALPDSTLMKLAEHIASRQLEAIALAQLGIEEPTITNLADVHGKTKEKLNFEILALWRNKTSKNTKEVIIYCKNKYFPVFYFRIISHSKYVPNCNNCIKLNIEDNIDLKYA